jgi:DNA-binding LacI/PurR family transcriptional regulator
MATIKDVAKHAGVTIGTVSRVLNNKKWVSEGCRARVQAAIKDLHYKPQAHARRLRQKQSRVWGILAPHHTKLIRSPFFADILGGIEEAAAENNYRLLLHPLNDTARAQLSYRNLLGDGSVDGMFVLNAWSTDISLRELGEANVPFVLINGKVTGQDDFPHVGVDNRGGVRKALEHLMEMGHERIAMINGRMTTTNAIERFQAFQEVLAERKMPLVPEWVAEGNYEENGGFEAAKKIFTALRKPTAVLCASDLMAMGAVRALREMDLKVPENVSIVGFDNMEEAHYHDPALTTVSFSGQEMGLLAAQKLIQLLEGETLKSKGTTLQAELIVRDSALPLH